MMDLGAQPIMIGKRLAQELGLAAENLAPCTFTIVTSIGHMERATVIFMSHYSLVSK